MFRFSFLLLCLVLTFSLLQPIKAKRPGSSSGRGAHGYPSSGGLSGGGRHTGGLSGGSHSNPSGGLSGGSHGYPPSGGSHTYPSSGGSHTYPSSGGSHTYPSSSGNKYPSSGNGYPSSGSGLSGTGSGSHGYPSTNKQPSSGHGYPSSGSGVSGTGSGSHGYPGGKGLSGNTQTGSSANVHYHYHYNPPAQIKYTPVHGGPAVSYPVYRGSPPTYVYQYKDSGSRYGTLLAGLALLNLGTLAGTAYASRHASYKPQPGEICKFGVKKSNGDYEETKIGCELITSFIFQDQGNTQTNPNNSHQNASVVTTTVTNVTTITTGNNQSQPSLTGQTYTMLPNGTLVPVNVTTNATNNGANVTSTVTMTTTTTTNSTQVTNAIDVKGKEIEVTPGMQCYVIRTSPSSNMKKSVPCSVLQSYANQSLRRNSAGRHKPTIALMAVMLAVFAAY